MKENELETEPKNRQRLSARNPQPRPFVWRLQPVQPTVGSSRQVLRQSLSLWEGELFCGSRLEVALGADIAGILQVSWDDVRRAFALSCMPLVPPLSC